MIFRPTESSKNITDFYREYLLTTFSTNNTKYNDQLRAALNNDEVLAKGPFISISDPYKKGVTLRDLANEGIVSSELLKMQSFHPDRSLYLHQEEAVRKDFAGKNLVITTGTGSGKTESFLIPLINELMKEKEAGTLSAGVRALIIYPMNALVNDQIRRIRELLTDYPECGITFGKFTGETEEKRSEALKNYKENNDGEIPLEKCELISREEMRKSPPNILITNYAMLEYMLLRPGDNIIFSEVNAEKWKYIVFDEAHSYTGAKGIEVGTLVKRVKAMLSRDDIRFILTSATLGGETSNPEIIKFAHSLCDASFDDSCIIRSHTQQAETERECISIERNIYTKLADMIRLDTEETELFEFINSLNIEYNGNSSNSALYDIILHDRYYYEIRKHLYKQVKTVKTLAHEMNVTDQQITDFITVASCAYKNGEKLFEARYHMFFRGIEGVYVTLKPLEKLFIHPMENYLNPEDELEYKVYSISFCSNCSALFIAGENENGYLIQHSKYKDDYYPDVYLLSDDEYDSDEVVDEDENKNIYYVCSRCGHMKHDITKLECGHGAKYASKIRRIKEKGEKLHKCPCCNSIDTHRSIVRPYFLGAEAATSVIATSLYNELPGKIVKPGAVTVKKNLFGKLTEVKSPDTVKLLSKQFLAFSDNRQSAAFYASYLENTYNDTFLKRVMYELICDKSEYELNDFINELTRKIDDNGYGLKKRTDSYTADSWIYAIKELSNYKAKNSLASLGIMEFIVPIDISDPLKDYDLNIEETRTFLQILLHEMMKDAVVSTGVNLPENSWEMLSPSGYRKYYSEAPSVNSEAFIAWLPEKGKINKRMRIIQNLLGLKEDDARNLLSNIFDYFKSEDIITEEKYRKYRTESTVYLLNHNKIKVRKTEKLYKCSVCQKKTIYNFRNKCENPLCTGILSEYNLEKEGNDNHYRNLYTRLFISPMRVEEHTAQLSPQTAAEFQREFKNKKINVLSCSTTFEMGVDVGSLETVFMRNMPPTPANYAQRAGRAGRSFYSAAYAVTFCSNNSHDLNYYKNPVEMINGTINPPCFNMDNDKIVLRHMISTALSWFWRKNPNFYKSEIGDFMNDNGFNHFKEYLCAKPNEVKEMISKIVPASLHNYFGIESFSWIKYLFSDEPDADALCDVAEAKYREEIKNLEIEKKKLTDGNKVGVDSITRSLRTIRSQRMIDFLSKNNIIPKYGFPVDTVELIETGTKKEPLRLSRDLLTAISEYAPESEIVANKRLIKSKYIKKLSGYEWPVYKYTKCLKCGTLNRGQNLSVVELKKCQQCGEELSENIMEYVIPKFGFIADKISKPVGTNKPERSYHGEISYIGDEKSIEYKKYLINGITAYFGNSRMDSLLVLNESNFYVCSSCGYTKKDDKVYTMHYESKSEHYTSTGAKCPNKNMHKYSLGHEFKTDVILIKVPAYYESRNLDVAWTILYSLLEGLSHCLNVDRNELSGCLQWYSEEEEENYGFVLFDNTPGGAGYVRQLENPDVIRRMLIATSAIVNNCQCGGELADTVCYGCLCNYYNQKQHEILKRKYAITFCEEILSNPEVEIIEIDDEQEELIDSSDLKEKSDTSKINESPGYKVELKNKGRKTTIKDVLNDLLDDCEKHEEELINKLFEKLEGTDLPVVYRESFTIPKKCESVFEASLVIPDKKVMIFLSEYEDDYNEAKESEWKCFCTSDNLDISEIIEMLRRVE